MGQQQDRQQGYILPNPTPNLGNLSYVEVPDSHTWGLHQDSTQFSFEIDIKWSDFVQVANQPTILSKMMGFSRFGNQKTIQRNIPFQCPYFPYLWLTDISNGRPIKFTGKENGPFGRNLGILQLGCGSSYNRVRQRLTFTTLPYDVYDDIAIQKNFGNDESKRYVIKHPKPSVEYISLDKGLFQFVEGPANNPNGQQFNLGSGTVTCKVDIQWTWVNVPESFVMNNLTNLPSNINSAIGRVNNAPWNNFPEGTLLFLAAEFKPTTQPVSPLVIGYKSNFNPPRTWDVTLLFKYWQPPIGAGAVTEGWNTAFWVGDMLFYKIATKNGDLVFKATDFNPIFQSPNIGGPG